MDSTEHDASVYTVPLEVGFNDVRECRIDKSTLCADVLTALLGKPQDRSTGAWAILETVYERGVLSNLDAPPAGKPNKESNKAVEPKKPQMVIKELRLLEPSQPMHELVRDVNPEIDSVFCSTLSVINASCECVVFFNPYFRMLTGLPLSHLSVFPDPDMTVAQLNRLVRSKLKIDPEDDRFAVYGFYGKHVARLEDKCIVSAVKATWEGDGEQKQVGFFQFQVVPERANHELLGIERASWLFVRKEAGIWQSTKKLYCVLKGTTLFMYKAQRSADKYAVITNVDACRVLNLGANMLRTRHFFQIIESVCLDGQQRPVVWSFSSPYPSRVKKWLRVLGRCHRSYDSQVPVTYADPDGEAWLRGGRVSAERRRPFCKLPYKDRKTVDPSLVSAGEMTAEQRSRFDHIDAMLRACELSGEVVKKAGCDQSPDLATDWLGKVRLFALEATSLLRPGFAEKAIPVGKRLVKKASVFAPSLSGSLRQGILSTDAVDEVLAVCGDLAFFYKQHTLDLASFPSSPTRHEFEFGPQLVELRMILENERYFEHIFEDDLAGGVGDEGVDEEVDGGGIDEGVDGGGVDEGVDEGVGGELGEPGKVKDDQETTVCNEETPELPEAPEATSERVQAVEEEPFEEECKLDRKKEGSILKKMKKMLISRPGGVKARPLCEPALNTNPQIVIEISPESPVVTDVSAPDQTPTATTTLDATINETELPSIPSRRSTKSVPLGSPTGEPDEGDAKSVASTKSSFSQRAKAMWNRVSSPLGRASPRPRDSLEPTATFPYAATARPMPDRPMMDRPFTTTHYNPDDLSRKMSQQQSYPPPMCPYPMYQMPPFQYPPPPMMYPMMMPYPMMPMPEPQHQQHQQQQQSMWSQFMSTMQPPQAAPNSKSGGEADFCRNCGNIVGEGDETVRVGRSIFHSDCFKCGECGARLRKGTYKMDAQGALHCLKDRCATPAEAVKSSAPGSILKSLNTIDVPRRLKTLNSAD